MLWRLVSRYVCSEDAGAGADGADAGAATAVVEAPPAGTEGGDGKAAAETAPPQIDPAAVQQRHTVPVEVLRATRAKYQDQIQALEAERTALETKLAQAPQPQAERTQEARPRREEEAEPEDEAERDQFPEARRPQRRPLNEQDVQEMVRRGVEQHLAARDQQQRTQALQERRTEILSGAMRDIHEFLDNAVGGEPLLAAFPQEIVQTWLRAQFSNDVQAAFADPTMGQAGTESALLALADNPTLQAQLFARHANSFLRLMAAPRAEQQSALAEARRNAPLTEPGRAATQTATQEQVSDDDFLANAARLVEASFNQGRDF